MSDDNIGRRRSRRLPPILVGGWGFDWNQIAPIVSVEGLEILPPAAELIAPGGKYYADHLSATRHIVSMLWDHTRREAAAGYEDYDRRIEARLYDVMVRLTRAETAIMQAECVRVQPRHSESELARALFDEHVQALQEAAGHVQHAADLLEEIDGEDQLVEVDQRNEPKEKPKETSKEKGVAGGVGQDALGQIKLILKTIQDIAALLVPPKKRDDVTKLIQELANAITGGAKAAIIGAITALVQSIDSDASAKDIIYLPGPNGEVTIYFRVRKGCLFLFDWAVSDDYVFIKKSAKGAEPTFVTDDPAKELGKKLREKLEKELTNPPATPPAQAPTPPSTPAPSPAPGKPKYF